MSRADFEKDMVIEVWADNWPIFQIFAYDLNTQWRVGMGGPYGLDYNVLPFLFRTRGIARSQWPQALDDIRTMEQAALKEMQQE